jgi:tetratricopeptide (TPR) repeat protein
MRKLALVLGALLQGFSGYLVWENKDLFIGLGGHLAGALLWGWGAVLIQPAKTRWSAWFGGAVALVIPGFGWVCSVAVLSILRSKPPRSKGRTLIVWRDRKLRTDFGVLSRKGVRSSIAEILRGPDPSRRRSAILAVKELDVRVALPLLRKGLQDSDEQVRIYAQNILSSLLESFESRIKDLEKRARTYPIETATAVSLAEQYFELVYLDVAGDEETSAHLLEKAIDLLDRAAKQSPKNGHIALLRLRYALRQRDIGEARESLRKLSALVVDEQMVMPWKMELAYQCRDWTGMRRLLGEFVRKGFVNPRIETMAEFWRATEIV